MAGSIFAATHLPLTIWFRAMDRLTQSKNPISSIELGRRLDRDGAAKLGCRVEMDDAYLGGERRGRKRGAAGKTPFPAAVETTPDGKPHRMKLCRVEAFAKAAIG